MKAETAVQNLRKLADFCEEYDIGPIDFAVSKLQVHISVDDWPRLSQGQRVEIESRSEYDWHTTTIDGVSVLALLRARRPTSLIEVVEDYQPA